MAFNDSGRDRLTLLELRIGGEMEMNERKTLVRHIWVHKILTKRHGPQVKLCGDYIQ